MYHFNFIDKIEWELKGKYADNYADFSMHPGGRKVYDGEIAEFCMKHLKPWDWLNPYKVTSAIQWAFTCIHDEILHGVDREKTWKEVF